MKIKKYAAVFVRIAFLFILSFAITSSVCEDDRSDPPASPCKVIINLTSCYAGNLSGDCYRLYIDTDTNIGNGYEKRVDGVYPDADFQSIDVDVSEIAAGNYYIHFEWDYSEEVCGDNYSTGFISFYDSTCSSGNPTTQADIACGGTVNLYLND